MAEERKGDLDEVVSCPRAIEHGAEEHEEEDERGRDSQGDAKDALSSQPLL